MNEINARRINDEYNVFQGLHKSPIFLAVLVVTLALQVIIMETPLSKVFKASGLQVMGDGVPYVTNACIWRENVSMALTAATVPLRSS